jgi:hypothetical protein
VYGNVHVSRAVETEWHLRFSLDQQGMSDDEQSGQIHVILTSKNVVEVGKTVGTDGSQKHCAHNHVKPGIAFPIDSMNAHRW